MIGATRFLARLLAVARADARPGHLRDRLYLAGREALRTGANTEMKRLMLTHAFEVWEVRSVCLHTDVRNQRSRDAIQRIGGKFEGILRAHRLAVDLSPRDSARFSITAAEWPAVRQHLDELARALPASLTTPAAPACDRERCVRHQAWPESGSM